MSQRLKNNIALLHLLANCKKEQRDAILKTLARDQILAICECVHNILEGTVPIDNKTIKNLRRKREQLAKIRNKKVPLRQRKQLIIQTGGFLPGLLIPIISTAAGLLGDLLIKKL